MTMGYKEQLQNVARLAERLITQAGADGQGVCVNTVITAPGAEDMKLVVFVPPAKVPSVEERRADVRRLWHLRDRQAEKLTAEVERIFLEELDSGT